MSFQKLEKKKKYIYIVPIFTGTEHFVTTKKEKQI